MITIGSFWGSIVHIVRRWLFLLECKALLYICNLFMQSAKQVQDLVSLRFVFEPSFINNRLVRFNSFLKLG